MKVFYYPLSCPAAPLRGTTTAMVAATLVVFVITWLLHAYQWFWLRGARSRCTRRTCSSGESWRPGDGELAL